MSKGKPIEFDRDNITSVINEYKRVKKLNRHTQIEQSTIITDKYLKNKTAFPATKMYPNGIPIPYVLRALNKEQNDKYKSYGNQVKSYIEDLNMLRRFLVNDYIVLKNKLKAISETGSIKFSESMIKTEKSKIREKMDLIESWAFNNNEKLPDFSQPSNKYFGNWDGSIISLVEDLRGDKKAGVYKTYAEAYRHAEENITVNGEPVKAQKLENLYHKTKSVNSKSKPIK